MLDVMQQIGDVRGKLAQFELTQEVVKVEKVADEAMSIAQSTYARKRLNGGNLKSLSTDGDLAIDSLYQSQMERLFELGQLRNRYNQSETEREALAIVAQFDSLRGVVVRHSKELAGRWSALYDNRLFALNILIEHIDDSKLRSESLNISRASAAAIGDLGGDVADRAVVNYEYQRGELAAIELLIARRLSLSNAIDSLSRANKELSAKGVEGRFAAIEIEERSFIDYAPITFLSTQTYGKSNPIPATKIFKRGVVYRILYGGFTTIQQPSLFRGAKPLSVNKEDKLYKYYGGGYKSYREAVNAQKASKARGFNRPEVVMWRDGISHNISRQPFAKGSYRVVIKGCEELPESVVLLTKQYNKDTQITRAGGGYIISTFADKMIAYDLADEIAEIDREYNVTVE